MQIIKKQKLLYNCDLLLCESIELYKSDHFPRSCFLAMTAIEEAGKIITLWLNPGLFKGPPNYSEMSMAEIGKFFRDHSGKAAAATLTLSKNKEADRRYGIIPSTNLPWTLGVKELVDPRRWMDLRNSCLYVDVAPGKSEAISPQEAVLRDHASYMICMGHEVVADLADAGIEMDHNPDPWFRFKSIVLKRLQEFCKHYAESFEWSNLGLFADSETLPS